ncbi:hypothetical protein JW964_18050 [candidate division KSB1 bacterium]|nr:hypothetical protein [candidate division KSB1 bacterium]
MVKNNFHKDAFDDATKSKLEIFREYFKESFPVFVHSKTFDEIHFETSIPAHCHRTIANYFKSLIPNNKEYYIGCFSIKKGSNYYGLLFGSNHSLGAEKFQRVCWKKDSITGEADYNIDRELAYIKEQGMLFEEHKISVKVQFFKELLKIKILNREIVTDLDAYKFALINRCLIKHSAIVLKELMQESKIQKFITINSDIHKLKTLNNIIVL